MDMRKVGAPPLDKKVVDRLLDLLSSDDDFRALFQNDAKAALLQIGYQPAASQAGGSAITAESWDCLQIQGNRRLAAKADIIRDRTKLKTTLNAVINFSCPTELLAQ